MCISVSTRSSSTIWPEIACEALATDSRSSCATLPGDVADREADDEAEDEADGARSGGVRSSICRTLPCAPQRAKQPRASSRWARAAVVDPRATYRSQLMRDTFVLDDLRRLHDRCRDCDLRKQLF